LRGLYEIAVSIDGSLQSDQKLDIDKLLDKLSAQMASVRTSKQVVDNFLHFGKNNNSMEFVEDLIYGEDTDQTIPLGIDPFDIESGGVMRGSLVTMVRLPVAVSQPSRCTLARKWPSVVTRL
jgi:hypothetical protein